MNAGTPARFLNAFAQALAALVTRPAAHDLHGLVEGLGVARRGDLLQRADAQLRVAVALQAGDDEAAAQLAGRVEVQHRLGIRNDEGGFS